MNEANIAAIDAKNQELAASIRLNNSIRNSLVPVAQLPVEVLCKVFMSLQESLVVEDVTAESWLVVTQICQTWREAALGDLQLWSSIKLGPSHPCVWMGKLLKRSRKATPLSVEIDGELDERRLLLLSDIFSQPHRLLSLFISGGPQVVEHAKKLQFASAHYLQKLVVNNVAIKPARNRPYSHYSNTPTTSPHDQPCIAHNLLSGGTPHLRHLELTSFIVPWSSPLFRGLTSLKVQIPLSHDFPGSPQDVLSALSSMPDLEILDLEVNFSASMSGFRRDVSIPFTKLSQIRLKTPIQPCITILSHITFPISASVELVVNEGSGYDGSRRGRDLMTALHSAWLSDPLSHTRLVANPTSPLQNARRIQTLTVSPDGDEVDVFVQAFFEEIKLEDMSTHYIPDPTEWGAELDIDETPSLVIHIQEGVVDGLLSSDSFLLDHLLLFNARSTLDDEVWRRFSQLPSLKSIFLNEVSAKGCVGWFKEPLFSNLFNICFTGVDFGIRGYGEGGPPSSEYPIGLHYITPFLNSRFKRHRPIQQLKLNSCVNLFAEDVLQLEKLTTNKVDWDRDQVRRNEDDIRPCDCYGGRDRCVGDCSDNWVEY